ncbi:CRISPR-associated endonuclease Cas2 [candidate division KSB3 bacterium]|nr:CRISPR-associated endonuclease Cas2 [candidate division KSB3 bacterium]
MKCLLVYDIPNDNIRTKIADYCLDYGLDRIQYSAFIGDLARTHQEELMLRVEQRLGERVGKIQLFPICKSDWRQRIEIIQKNEENGDQDEDTS